MCSEWKQELVTFSQFLDRMWSTVCPSKLTYLAQHPLFEQVADFSLLILSRLACVQLCILLHWIGQIKELSEDIIVPEYCYAGGGELQSLNAWFGPQGTVTPLHHDPHHNILAQVKDVYNLLVYP